MVDGWVQSRGPIAHKKPLLGVYNSMSISTRHTTKRDSINLITKRTFLTTNTNIYPEAPSCKMSIGGDTGVSSQ